MDSNLQRVIELNNLGAAHLNTQNLGDAIRTFRQGLEYLKHSHASEDQNITTDLHSDSSSFSQPDAGPFWIPVKKIDQDPTIMMPSTTTYVTVCAYSFCHPLLLEENANIPATPHLPLSVSQQISAVMLFNLALTHHGMGMRFARADLHRSAVRLYHMAHKLLQSIEQDWGQPPPGSSDSFLSILKLLSMNNMAQICYDELGDYEQMTVAVGSMQRLVMILVDECSGPPLFRRNNNDDDDDDNYNSSNSSERPARLVSKEDAASLLINAKMLQEPCTAGAA